MKAMILAAGRGERMRPLTDNTPKPLLEVGGRPLIVWHLQRLSDAGFKEVVINHAHLGAQIEAALGDGSQWELDIQYSPEKVALETAGGIANALSLLGSEPFLVVNGDVFSDIDFTALRAHQLGNALAHLVLVNNPPQHPQGDFTFFNNQLLQDGEPKLTFSGMGIYHPQLFKDITPGHAAKLAPLIRQAIAENRATAWLHVGMWRDIGTPQRLAELNQLLSPTT